MGEILEALLFEPKLLISLVVAAPIGFAIGSYFGFMAGLVSFGVSFAMVLMLLVLRAWSRRR
jgi:hypothetical protein